MTRVGRAGRAVVAAVAAVLVGAATLVAGAGASAAPLEDDPYAGSAASKQGTGRFADLTVTVDKTTNLSNESVDVSWQWTGDDTGSRGTPGTGYPYNFVQVFQCWGDGTEGAGGPPREQCQFGGNWSPSSDYFTLTPQSGQWFDTGYLVSRTVSRQGNQRLDPLEEAEEAGGPGYRFDPAVPDSGIVPLRAAPAAPGLPSRQVTSATTNGFFDRTLTNEVPVAQTSADGSGSTSIELHTRLESQFLGCGDRVGVDASGEPVTRPCYLVVVPRDNVEVNGAQLPALGQFRAAGMLGSSPLSLSNWENRIVFPLQFLPLRETCQLGTVERSVVGQEALSTAFLSWQSVLCRNELPVFYVSTVDQLARRNVVDNPQLYVVTDPVVPEPGETVDDLVYAPVGVSGVTVAFFVERQYNSATRPEELQAYDGTRATQLRLTPRLVAKLLTQSYGASVFTSGTPTDLVDEDNPASLIRDPDFRAVNTPVDGEVDPLTDIANITGADKDFATLLLPTTSSDAVRSLWTWVLADEDAAAFLDGEPDEFGMTVNTGYQGLERYLDEDGLPRSDIERPDQPCKLVGVGAGTDEEGPLCNGDANPLARSFEETALLTARGQPLGSESLEKNPTTGVVRVSRPGPQFPGQRTMLALTTTASAARLGLTTASLQNSSGDFVSPTVASMTAAAEQAAATRVPGVKRVDPADVSGAAYPLTTFSYAVTRPSVLDAGARADYAAVIDYAATDGQVQGIRPGNLPPGYAPLSQADRDLAVASAATIRSFTDPVPAATPTPTPTSTARAATTTSPPPAFVAAPLPPAAAPRPVVAPPLPAATPAPVLGPPVPVAEPPSPEPVALERASAITPGTPVALARIVPLVLAVGVVAALTGGGFVLFGPGGALSTGVAVSPAPGASPAPPPSPDASAATAALAAPSSPAPSSPSPSSPSPG